MKMSIGDVVDRYSICKLKNERLNLENSYEINSLMNEIHKYKNLDSFINDLYIVNGKIWDLEFDIRKKNEDILGLEEVGRRAIKIRELNGERVDLKNQINSIFNEGFPEIKMNHGSKDDPSLVISLTTVPERLQNDNEQGIKWVLKNLCEQNDNDYEVHFNIPHIYHITKQPYIIPQWLNDMCLKYKHLRVFRTEDYGPPTKFVPTVERIQNPETIILTVDDDLIYHEDMISEHRKYQNELIDSIVCYEGRGPYKLEYGGDLRDHWVICVTKIREVRSFQHYKSASYKRKLFTNIFFEHYLGKTFSDDVLISRYFHDNSYKMFVVPYEKENYKFETHELWQTNQGVNTFPILQSSHSIVDTGCNNKQMLAIQPKFYEPLDLGVPNYMSKQNVRNYDTDKFSHGYIPFYEKYFENYLNSDNILEIGIHKGESLRYLKDLFTGATIHGIDINNSSFLNSERIKTYTINQESQFLLENFIENCDFEFDIIIDDGCHSMKGQQTSFGTLFKKLKSGGMYIIEDLHTSYKERYPTHHYDDDEITTLEMIKNLMSNKTIVSNYILPENKITIQENLADVILFSIDADFKESITSIIIKK